jgi:hypothetical protein
LQELFFIFGNYFLAHILPAGVARKLQGDATPVPKIGDYQNLKGDIDITVPQNVIAIIRYKQTSIFCLSVNIISTPLEL